MDSIEILVNEHAYIKKVLAAIKKDCEEMAYGKEIDTAFYRNVIEFVRNFADKYHHQKEEKKLFSIMADMDENLRNGPIMGMILEHDLGRSYIKNLAEALDKYESGDKNKKAYVLANALSYAVMLEKHIEKEDTAIYVMARRMLSKEVKENMDKEFNEIEDDKSNISLRKKYIDFAESI